LLAGAVNPLPHKGLVWWFAALEANTQSADDGWSLPRHAIFQHAAHERSEEPSQQIDLRPVDIGKIGRTGRVVVQDHRHAEAAIEIVRGEDLLAGNDNAGIRWSASGRTMPTWVMLIMGLPSYDSFDQ
jgi:hypothetical protein